MHHEITFNFHIISDPVLLEDLPLSYNHLSETKHLKEQIRNLNTF